MTSKKQKSDDVLIEKIKIKQKILLDSLNSRVETFKDEKIIELNSKVDFLVKIFNEIKNMEEHRKEEFEKFKIEIRSSLEDLENRVNSKIDLSLNQVKEKVIENPINVENKINLPPKPNFGEN